MLINFVSPRVYEYIGECDNYNTAITLLKFVYVRPKNEALASHLLITHRQQSDETLDQFLKELKILAKDCNFQPVTADKFKKEYIRDAFINGLCSQIVRQRLLENKTLARKTMFNLARTYDLAQRSIECAYFQIPLREHEKKHTAFEANGRLYQLRRVSFGVTNGVACFQRAIDHLDAENKLEVVFVYIDYITIRGIDQNEHAENLRRFLNVADKHQLTFIDDKCVYSVGSVDLLGYSIQSDLTLIE
ncbi:unnamed protein product [Mytilus coruscus]|uniref:Reverse transcriptase domain-containing protein n=1 Tax=Mytilus coruscus TaxID=42192 RepID=A0A6J8B8L5_MYTCO|nr:unnamed protein product [Mytilus coruscus]